MLKFHLSQSEKAVDARARRAAKRAGFIARKSTWRKDSIDNHGGYMLVYAYANTVEAGHLFDLTAEEVVEYCSNN